jgi:hypothetical protein
MQVRALYPRPEVRGFTANRITNPAARTKRKTSQLGLRNAWKTEFNRAVDASGVSRSFKSALEEFSFKRNALAKDFTPHQLASLAACNPTTIYRNLQKAVDSGLLVLVQPGSHCQRKAALFRLAENFPTFVNFQRNFGKFQTAKRPSQLFSKENNRSTPSPLPEAQEAPPPKGGMASEKPLNEKEQTLALIMAEADSRPEGIKKAILAARMENRIDQALKDAKAVLAYIKTAPKWMQSSGGTMTRAIQNPERARRLKRQANYDKTLAKRQSAKPAPEPQKTSLEMDLAADWNFWRNEADSWPDEQRKTLQAMENDRARFVQEAARIWKAGL